MKMSAVLMNKHVVHHFLSYYQAHFIDIFIDTETTVMHVQFRTKHRYNKEKS